MEVIPEAAVEAAHKAWREQAALDGSIFEYNLRAALEAAAPHMLAECWDQAIEAHKAWMWDEENMDPLANPYKPTL